MSEGKVAGPGNVDTDPAHPATSGEGAAQAGAIATSALLLLPASCMDPRIGCMLKLLLPPLFY